MGTSSQSVRRVALLIETTRTYTREVLVGVRRYIAEHGPWSAFVELRALDSSPPAWLRTWDGDGILTRTFTSETARAVTATGLPAIELRATRFGHALPFIGMDNRRIGEMVAEHFLNRGYRDFAVYSLDTETFFQERVENFVATVEAKGFRCDLLPSRGGRDPRDWEKSQARLVQWLGALPRPVGVFATNDQLGVRVLDACQRAGIAVPEEVAVVGCENEETLCNFATPTLTSVQLDGARVGYRAAEALDALMAGGASVDEATLVAPRGIVARRSSDDLVINDGLVAHAARMIRERAMGGILVDDLCRSLNVSRSTLERRMKAALGRTPKAEILRLRFREVERLLRDTDLTVEAIAGQTGFAHCHYLQSAFKERLGKTPGQYRRAAKGGGGFG
ncbi:MAG: substrate-binding domain-containing protein [Verrucomicrobiales bacterium]